MRWYTTVSIIIILALSMNQASAATFSPGEIEWATAVTGTLHKGGTLTNGEYMVKAVQFPAGVPGKKTYPSGAIVPEDEVDPMVFLEIYKNGVMIKEFVMTIASEAYIDPDYEVKVTTPGFILRNDRGWVLEYYDPWATVAIQKRALPKLEVTVTTDKPTYTSNNAEIITAKVELKNTGDAFIQKVDLDLNIGELKLRGGELSQLHKSYDKIIKGETKSFEVILVVPDLIDEKTYYLNASSKGYDLKDLTYNATGFASPTVSPKQNYFSISKAVRNRIYLQDYASVRITVGNGGIYNIYNIHITDNMSDKFVLTSSSIPFAWDIPVLKPGEEWGTSYSIKPTEANIDGWTIPASSATFTVNNKPYSTSSSTITLIVNGPRLIINKTVSKPIVNISEDVTVTVSINNIGNVGTKTEVKDLLPNSVSLVSGQLSQLNFSEPAKEWGFSYIIRMNKEGDYELPSAIANYTNVEYRGFVHDVKSSDRPVIMVIDPSKPRPVSTEPGSQSTGGTPSSQGNPGTNSQGTSEATSTPEPTPTPITPGFEFVFAVFILIFAAGFMRK